jgi:hypothetical protein
MSLSGLIIGPLSYWWYKYLDYLHPSKTFSAIMKKILYDQLVGATFFTFIFIMTVCLMDGMSLSQSFNEFKDKFVFIYFVRTKNILFT